MNRKVLSLRAVSIISAIGFLFYPINFFSLIWPNQNIQELSVFQAVITFVFAYAWFSWGIMAVTWLFDKKLSRYWPISGCITGTISVIVVSPLVVPILLLLPSIILAISFCRFHLKRNSVDCLQ